jgi:hypothetical protein
VHDPNIVWPFGFDPQFEFGMVGWSGEQILWAGQMSEFFVDRSGNLA